MTTKNASHEIYSLEILLCKFAFFFSTSNFYFVFVSKRYSKKRSVYFFIRLSNEEIKFVSTFEGKQKNGLSFL